MMHKKNLYILGTRGIPASYGGFETFAEKLALYMASKDWNVRVYCQSDVDKTEIWNGIECVHLKSPKGAFGTIIFDWRAIIHALRNRRQNEVWLTLGYNTAIFNTIPMMLGRKQIINMDGVEWRRRKWSWPEKVFLYVNYFFGGWVADLLIGDHPEIAAILQKNFQKDKIRMIAYGGYPVQSVDQNLLTPFNLQPDQYCVVIARAEPENNILEIVRAWSAKHRGKKLVILGKYDPHNTYHRQIVMDASSEVYFIGPVYDAKTVEALRHYSYAYIHGHSVGGTNPSLVEAIAAQCRIIAHDNVFNRWVAGDDALYFKNENDLSEMLEKPLARQTLNPDMHWDSILSQYRYVLEHIAD